MKILRNLLAGLVLVSCSAVAQTAKNRAALYTDIDTNLPNNTSGGITPAILRAQFKDVVASAFNTINADAQPVNSNLSAISLLSTQTFGLSLLTKADAAAAKLALALVKGDVGLGNVDNTADTSKPVSTAQAAADATVLASAASDATTKANAAAAASIPLANLSTNTSLGTSNTAVPSQNAVKTYVDANVVSGGVPGTRTVNGHALSADVVVTKSDLSLGNVDNTSDSNKPVSTAQATANTAVQTAAASDATTKANAAQAAAIAASTPKSQVVPIATFVFDGGGSVVPSGQVTNSKPIPAAATITGYTITSDVSGSAVVTVSLASGGGSFSTITASAPPTLSSASYVDSATLTGWTTSVPAHGRVRGAISGTPATVTLVTVVVYGTLN